MSEPRAAVIEADLSNPEHQDAVMRLIDAYALDPMGDGKPLAALATVWLRDPALYRRAIVIPGSAAIAIMGLWWTVTRVFGG